MKLRKTIYPLALIIAIPLVLVVFYILNQGKFEKPVESPLLVADAEEKDATTLEYDLNWKGLGKPHINKITFSGAENMELKTFVKLFQEEAKNEMEVEETEPGVYEIELNGPPLPEKQLMIKLKATDENREAIGNIKISEIEYKTFGIMRKQNLENK